MNDHMTARVAREGAPDARVTASGSIGRTFAEVDQ
jgi:hypothetical protein